VITVYGSNVYLGLMHIERLETRLAQLVSEERNQNGDYTSLENFVKKIPIGIETLQILIFIGAFRNLNNSQTANHFNLSRNTVSKWRKRFETH